MKQSWIKPLILTALVLVVSFYFLKYNPTVSAFVSSNEKILTDLNSVIMVFTVFSILFSVFAYYEEKNERQKINREDNKSLTHNALIEIDLNLELAKFVKDHLEEFKKIEGGLPTSRFNYFSLQKIVDIIKDNNIRKNMIKIIDEMDTANRIIEYIISYQGPILMASHEAQLSGQVKAYKDMRVGNLEKFKNINKEIESLLGKIKNELVKKNLEFLDKI